MAKTKKQGENSACSALFEHAYYSSGYGNLHSVIYSTRLTVLYCTEFLLILSLKHPSIWDTSVTNLLPILKPLKFGGQHESEYPLLAKMVKKHM